MLLPIISGPDILHRRMSSSSRTLMAKPSSKIEETVNRLKKKHREKQKRLLDNLEEVEELNRRVRDVIEADKKELQRKQEKEARTAVSKKKGLWARTKDEVYHYYSGFKLLCLELRITSRILWKKVLAGKELTRRENRQLVRTVSDIFRILPFSVFILVPFLELALPLVLKFFPALLPSTFRRASEKEAKMRRALKAKIEYSKFLQRTLDEMAPQDTSTRTSGTARDFVEFYKTVKEHGITVVNKDILKFSQLFEDEITLDNMTRSQLVALCKMLEFSPIGTTNFLRQVLKSAIVSKHDYLISFSPLPDSNWKRKLGV